MDGVHQFTVGVGVLRADLQDVLPKRGILRYPHLKHTQGKKTLAQETTGLEEWILNTEFLDTIFIHKGLRTRNCSTTVIISEMGLEGVDNCDLENNNGAAVGTLRLLDVLIKPADIYNVSKFKFEESNRSLTCFLVITKTQKQGQSIKHGLSNISTGQPQH